MRTRRLLIRPMEKEDWKDMQSIWEDFNRSAYVSLDMPHDTREKSLRRQIAKWVESSSGTSHLFLSVCLQEQMIGFYAFHRREDSHKVGYRFKKQYQKMGYGKESFLSLVPVLKQMGISSITAGTAFGNPPFRVLSQIPGISDYRDRTGIFLPG